MSYAVTRSSGALGSATPVSYTHLIPRRVYTQSHIDYVAEAIETLNSHKDQIKGLRIAWQASVLRHFTARFEPVN